MSHHRNTHVEGLCPFTFHTPRWHRSNAPAAMLVSTRNCLRIRNLRTSCTISVRYSLFFSLSLCYSLFSLFPYVVLCFYLSQSSSISLSLSLSLLMLFFVFICLYRSSFLSLFPYVIHCFLNFLMLFYVFICLSSSLSLFPHFSMVSLCYSLFFSVSLWLCLN